MKKAIISLSIITLLSICMFSNVAAEHVSKHPTDVHSNYVVDVRGKQQTYIFAGLGLNDATAATIGVGQWIWFSCVLSSTPVNSSYDSSHGIGGATINLQSMNSDGKTWSTVATFKTSLRDDVRGALSAKLTPTAAGVYTYRATYDGENYYEPSVSNVVTITVANMVIS